MGFPQHSGVVIVCDGTDEAAARIARVLTNDPATGVMRHADAGYEIAINCAKEQGLHLHDHAIKIHGRTGGAFCNCEEHRLQQNIVQKIRKPT